MIAYNHAGTISLALIRVQTVAHATSHSSTSRFTIVMLSTLQRRALPGRESPRMKGSIDR